MLKSLRRIGMIVAAITLAGCAAIPSDAPPFSTAPEPPRGYAVAYFYRTGAYPSKRRPDILINERRVFEPLEETYTWVALKAGTYRLHETWASGTGAPDADLSLVVEAGRNYFIRITGSKELGMLIFRSAFVSLKFESHLIQVPESEALKELAPSFRFLPPEVKNFD